MKKSRITAVICVAVWSALLVSGCNNIPHDDTWDGDTFQSGEYTKFYIVGDASPSGWYMGKDASRMTPLVKQGDGVFTYNGNLYGGNLLIAAVREGETPSLASAFLLAEEPGAKAAGGEQRAVFSPAGIAGGGESGWTIDLEANYLVTLDRAKVTVSIATGVSQTIPGAAWLVGDATPGGASLSAATAMASGENGVFVWTGSLNAGKFKIVCTDTDSPPVSGSPCFLADADEKKVNDGASQTAVYNAAGTGSDRMWKISSGDVYTVTLDTLNNRLEVGLDTSDRLWLVGSAAPGGWSLDRAAPMVPAETAGVFIWEGRLIKGELKFTFGAKPLSFETSPWYLAAAANTEPTGSEQTIRYSPAGSGDNDWKFIITTVAKYTITVNTETLTVRIAIIPGTEEAAGLDRIWLVGDAAPNGWSIGSATPMTNAGSGVFTWTGRLKAGEIKFTCDKQDNWGGAWFLAGSNGLVVNGFEQDVRYSPAGDGGKDWKFSIVDAGTYTVTLDTGALKAKFVKQDGSEPEWTSVWLVGAATPNGWDLSSATPMTQAGNGVFTWTGTLTTNDTADFKFTCDKRSDFNGEWFLAAAADTVPDGTEQSVRYSASGDGGADYKFKIVEGGTYTITLKTKELKVIIVRVGS